MQELQRGRELQADRSDFFFPVPQNEENELLIQRLVFHVTVTPNQSFQRSMWGTRRLLFQQFRQAFVFIVGHCKNSDEQKDFTEQTNSPFPPVRLLVYSFFHLPFLRAEMPVAPLGMLLIRGSQARAFSSFLPQLRNWKFGNCTKFKVLAFVWSSHPSAGETHCPGLFKKSFNGPEYY